MKYLKCLKFEVTEVCPNDLHRIVSIIGLEYTF